MGGLLRPGEPGGSALAVPLDADPFPRQAEPLGGLLALFTALFDDSVRAVYVRGGSTGCESPLQGPFYCVPHGALIPGALTAGDLCDIAGSLAPRPLRMEGLVDGLDRAAEPVETATVMEPARSAYRAAAAGPRLQLVQDGAPSPTTDLGFWGALIPDPAPRPAR